MFVFVNKLTLTGSAAELERIYAHVAEFMLAQPGIVRYQLVRSQKDPGVYVNVAEWETQEAFEKALSEPEFKNRLRALAPVAKGEPHRCDVVESAAAPRPV